MAEWWADVYSLLPQGQLAEILTVVRYDKVSGACEVMEATMRQVHPSGCFRHPEEGSPFIALSPGGEGAINELLQCLMDLGWKRGLRPAKFDASAGELAAVKAHLEDMRVLDRAGAPKIVGFGDAPPD